MTPLEPAQTDTTFALAVAPDERVDGFGAELGARVLAGEVFVVAKLRQEVGLPVERGAEQSARTEHAARAFCRERSLAERVDERRGAGRAFGEAAELQQ